MANRRSGWNLPSSVAAALLVASGLLVSVEAHAASTCQGLLTTTLPQATVVAAVPVPGPSFTAPNGQTYQGLPPFCMVSIVATPTPDSLINISLWMPDTPGWNGRFEGTGNGGYAGTIAVSVPAMIAGLEAGFSVAGTDMGTVPSTNNDADALVGHPEKWADFGWRATHLMTSLSKTVIAAFYGQSPRYSYFNGCSTGGQQALMEAERFPDDYDGILRGDAAENRTHVHTAVVWNYRALHASASSLFTSGQEQSLTNAIVAACVVKSGGVPTDGFLTDPRSCTFDPGTLQCSSTLQSNCLNADQVAAARLIYQGAKDPATGALIFTGSVRGSESDSQFGWAGIESQAEPPFDSLFKWVFGATWLWQSFDFNQNMTEVDQVLAPVLNANSVDLSAFKSHGGKLLMYHGWADPLIAPQDSIDYYLRLIASENRNPAAALAETQSFARLFMVPGMYHCAYGPGPNAFGNLFSGLVTAPAPPVEDAQHDAFIALQQWVEHGVAPTELIATKYVDDVQELGIAMQRPICAYPKVPRYTGQGNTNDAANFDCVTDDNTNNPSPAPQYLH